MTETERRSTCLEAVRDALPLLTPYKNFVVDALDDRLNADAGFSVDDVPEFVKAELAKCERVVALAAAAEKAKESKIFEKLAGGM